MEYSKEKLIERAEEALKEIREETEIAESYLYFKKERCLQGKKTQRIRN